MKIIIEKIRNGRKIAKQHIESKLLMRLRIFMIIMSVIIGIVAYNIFLNQISAILAFAGLALGIVIGLMAGRMFKMSWHIETEKVVSRMDKIGFIFLAMYIAVEIGRKWFFGHWLEGAQLNAFGLAFLSGLLLGRFLSMIQSINKILIEEKKLNSNLYKHISNLAARQYNNSIAVICQIFGFRA